MNGPKQIEAFIAVVEHGSMAAVTLTQGAASVMIGRRVSALETHLGVKLLYRPVCYIAMTEQGAVFMEQCKKVLGEPNRVEPLVTGGYHKATGYPIVLALVAFNREHIASHAPGFLRASPDVCISLNLTDRVADLVRGDYDVGIHIGGTIDPNLATVHPASDKRMVCGTFTYFVKHGASCTLDGFAHHNCFVFSLQGSRQHGWYFQQNSKAVTVKANGDLDYNGGELLHRWVGEDLGSGWHLTWKIQPELESGALIMVLDDHALLDYDIPAAHPQQ